MRKELGWIALISSLAAALTVCGALNNRIDDLALQRDIYKSRAENWERDAINWATEAQEAEAQVEALNRTLSAVEAGPDGLRLTYIGEFNCTAYCSERYTHICGTGDGMTASGAPVQAGITVAVDPDILPLGSAIYIEGVGLRYAQDTGSAVKGHSLDIAVDTHEEALGWLGYGTHRVWLLEGGEPE